MDAGSWTGNADFGYVTGSDGGSWSDNFTGGTIMNAKHA
jgi:hypothetical protein